MVVVKTFVKSSKAVAKPEPKRRAGKSAVVDESDGGVLPAISAPCHAPQPHVCVVNGGGTTQSGVGIHAAPPGLHQR